MSSKKMGSTYSKAMSSPQGSSELREAMKELKEAAFVSILEDVQDADITSKDELLKICFLLEDHGQDEDGTKET